jgi:hypothetical protein
MSAPPIFQKGNIMKKSNVKIVDIAAIESAAKSKLNGDNKLKSTLGAVASQHMTGDASPELYAACKLAQVEGKRLNLDPIRELLPTLGRAQKDAVAALYLVLTTAPKTAAKAWDIKQASAKRKTATTLFGVRDAINELNSDSSKLAENDAATDAGEKASGKRVAFTAKFAKAWDKLPKELQNDPRMIELFDLRAEIE